MCAGMMGTLEESVSMCWHHLPSRGKLVPTLPRASGYGDVLCSPVRYLPNTCTANVPWALHFIVYKDRHVCQASCSVPCPSHSPHREFHLHANTGWSALSKNASLKHITYHCFLWSVFTIWVSVLISPAPVLLGRSLTSCQKRRCVHIAFWCLEVLVSSTQALNVSVVNPIGRSPAQNFFKVTHHHLWKGSMCWTPGPLGMLHDHAFVVSVALTNCKAN